MQNFEFKSLKQCEVKNKNIMLRVDINVPIVNGKIEDETRIRAVIPTIKYLAQKGAKVILIAHFGRPEGKFDDSMSLRQLLPRMKELLAPIAINFAEDCIGEKVASAIASAQFGEVVMLENLRFYKQETKGDEEFSRQLATFAEIYVNDAFSCSHRSHSSITGIPNFLPAFAGFLMEQELTNLQKLLGNAKGKMMAVVGGAKVSTKIDLLHNLSKKASKIFVGGGMANSFLFALKYNIGKSLCEKDLATNVLEIMSQAKKNGCEIILPVDLVVAKKFEQNAANRVASLDSVEENDIILDIGPATGNLIARTLEECQILVWNGPLGAFEIKPFNRGTEDFARKVAKLTQDKKILSVAGGGDVVSAINSCNLADQFTYISTAGGAFLEWLEGKELPGISALSISNPSAKS